MALLSWHACNPMLTHEHERYPVANIALVLSVPGILQIAQYRRWCLVIVNLILSRNLPLGMRRTSSVSSYLLMVVWSKLLSSDPFACTLSRIFFLWVGPSKFKNDIYGWHGIISLQKRFYSSHALRTQLISISDRNPRMPGPYMHGDFLVRSADVSKFLVRLKPFFLFEDIPKCQYLG